MYVMFVKSVFDQIMYAIVAGALCGVLYLYYYLYLCYYLIWCDVCRVAVGVTVCVYGCV